MENGVEIAEGDEVEVEIETVVQLAEVVLVVEFVFVMTAEVVAVTARRLMAVIVFAEMLQVEEGLIELCSDPVVLRAVVL